MIIHYYKQGLKNFKLFGLFFVIVTVVTVTTCSIWPETTSIVCHFYNKTDHDLILNYSTIETNGEDTLSVCSLNGINLLYYVYDGVLDKPSEDNFSTYIHYIKVFINDSLVYSQDPSQIELWSYSVDYPEDGVKIYHYTFTLQDSMIVYD